MDLLRNLSANLIDMTFGEPVDTNDKSVKDSTYIINDVVNYFAAVYNAP